MYGQRRPTFAEISAAEVSTAPTEAPTAPPVILSPPAPPGPLDSAWKMYGSTLPRSVFRARVLVCSLAGGDRQSARADRQFLCLCVLVTVVVVGLTIVSVIFAIRLGRVAGRISAVEHGVNHLQQQGEERGTQMTELQAAVEGVERRVDEVERNHQRRDQEVDHRVDGLEERLEEHARAVEGFKLWMTDIERTFTAGWNGLRSDPHGAGERGARMSNNIANGHLGCLEARPMPAAGRGAAPAAGYLLSAGGVAGGGAGGGFGGGNLSGTASSPTWGGSGGGSGGHGQVPGTGGVNPGGQAILYRGYRVNTAAQNTQVESSNEPGMGAGGSGGRNGGGLRQSGEGRQGGRGTGRGTEGARTGGQVRHRFAQAPRSVQRAAMKERREGAATDTDSGVEEWKYSRT